MVNQTNYQILVGTGDLFSKTLMRADIDNDNYTEFMFIKQVVSTFELVLVNCDNDTVRTYNFTVPSPEEIITGDFNGDGHTDVAVYNDVRIEMKDLWSGTNIGFYDPAGTIARALVGNFTPDSFDEIAILHTTGTDVSSLTMYLEIISGNGLQLNTVQCPDVLGIDAIRYTGNDILDCIAVTSMQQGGANVSYPVIKGFYANLTEVFQLSLPNTAANSMLRETIFLLTLSCSQRQI